MNIETIKTRIKENFKNAEVSVEGDGCNCSCTVISDDFAGMTKLARHRSVLALFAAEIENGDLHALSVKTRTADENPV